MASIEICLSNLKHFDPYFLMVFILLLLSLLSPVSIGIVCARRADDSLVSNRPSPHLRLDIPKEPVKAHGALSASEVQLFGLAC